MQGTPARRGESFAEKYERLLSELLDMLSGPRVLLRLNSEGLPEAALVFDAKTGRTVRKVTLPLGGGEAA